MASDFLEASWILTHRNWFPVKELDLLVSVRPSKAAVTLLSADCVCSEMHFSYYVNCLGLNQNVTSMRVRAL
jgi:hypothetical protein